MRYKHFQSADVDASVMAVGTWALGGKNYGEVEDQSSVAAIRKMLDCGVNLIDTAPQYGLGHAEEVVGQAIKGYDRSKLLISTKFGQGETTLKYQRGIAGGPILRDGSRENCFAECEASLKRLGTDYIDFYFVHWADYETSFAETMGALTELQQQGKIRFIGVSNFTRDMIWESSRWAKISAVQLPYSMVNQTERALAQWCESVGLSVFSYGSLGSGILTGAIRQIPNWAPDDMRFVFYDFYREPKFSKCQALLREMDALSAETSHPLAQIALNWSTQKSYIHTAMCGVRTPAEAIENCAAFDWSLTDQQIQRLDALIAKLDI